MYNGRVQQEPVHDAATPDQEEVQQLLQAQYGSQGHVIGGHATSPAAPVALQVEGVHSRGATVSAATGDTVSGLQISSSTSSSSTEAAHTAAVLCLCGTHALARWGWRTWEFAVVRSLRDTLCFITSDNCLLLTLYLCEHWLQTAASTSSRPCGHQQAAAAVVVPCRR